MDQLIIRNYMHSDKEEVKKLYELASIQSEIGYRAGSCERDFEDIETYYKDGAFLVGVLDGSIIAIGGLQKISETVGHVRRMRVHPEKRRKGFAGQILARLENEARKNNFIELRLRTSTEQKMAQNFYEKSGFRRMNAEKSFYKEGDGKTFEVIWFMKNLK